MLNYVLKLFNRWVLYAAIVMPFAFYPWMPLVSIRVWWWLTLPVMISLLGFVSDVQSAAPLFGVV